MTSQISLDMSNMEASDGISLSETPPEPSKDAVDDDDTINNQRRRPSLAWLCLKKPGAVLLFIVVVIACIVILPFFLVYLAGGWFFCGLVNQVTNDGSEKGDGATKNIIDNNMGYFQKLRGEVQKTTLRVRVAKLPVLIRSRLVILCLAWFIVNLSVPGLRKKDFLGTHLWKWSFLLALILCGYHFFSYATRFVVHLLLKNDNFKKNSSKAEYYIKGLRRSISLVLYSGSVLLTWVFYFRTNRGIRENGDTDDLLHIGTWTFVSLAVTAILWLLKNVLLLIWEADAVYNRFRLRILSTGSMCYFLGHIYGSQVSIFQPRHSTDDINDHEQLMSDTRDDHKKDDQVVDHQSNPQDDQKKDDQKKDDQKKDDQKKDDQKKDDQKKDDQKKDDQKKDDQKKDDQKKDDHQKESQSLEASIVVATEKQKKQETKDKAKKILLINKHTTIYDIKKRAEYFTMLSKLSSREDDGTSDVLAQCQRIQPSDREDLKKEDFEEFELEESDAIELLGVLKEGHKADQKVTYKHFEKSMVKAHKNCVELGHTLVDAMGVVQVLDRVLTLVLAVIAIIAWLLLTDLASTKLLVLIASPLLGATFIFGGTCKMIFEGIIFTFINHPFDVGDNCIIEKNELEVKRMSVLATTFTVIGSKEEALYPNSALASIRRVGGPIQASIPIVNLKGEPDPNDQIELTLDPSYTTPMLDELQAKILEFFEADKGERYNKNPTLEIQNIGKRSIRMVIQYQHVISNNETTHSQCLEKKRRQRSKLLIQLKQFTEEVSNGRKVGRAATIS